MKKSFWIYLFILLLFLMINLNHAFSKVSVKVGGLIPLTGRWGDLGRECARGMLDAAKWINLQGSGSKWRLEIVLNDDSQETAEVIAAYRKMNESDHILLLYIYSFETANSLLPHIHLHRIPTLISSSPPSLNDPSKYPFLFSLTPSPLDLVKIGMKFISENSSIKLKKPKVVFIGSPDRFGNHFLEDGHRYAKQLGLEVGPDIWISDPQPQRNIPLALTTMNTYGPDFAYLSLTSKETLLFLQESNKLGLKSRYLGGMRAFDETISTFDGVLGVQPISPFGEDVPGMVEIKEAHQKWHPYDSHTLSYVEGWATVKLIVEALKRSLPEQGYSRERVKMALETFRNFVTGGLLPPITFTATDHRPSVESRIFIIKEGKLRRHTGFISIGRE